MVGNLIICEKDMREFSRSVLWCCSSGTGGIAAALKQEKRGEITLLFAYYASFSMVIVLSSLMVTANFTPVSKVTAPTP